MLQQPPFIHGTHCPPLACLAQQLRPGERSREVLLSTRGPVSLLWYVTSQEVRALCDLEVYANHCASMMTLLPHSYALLCSLTGLLLLIAEAITSFDIYLRHRSGLLQRIQYINCTTFYASRPTRPASAVAASIGLL